VPGVRGACVGGKAWGTWARVLGVVVAVTGCREPQHQRDVPGEGDVGLEIRRRTAQGSERGPNWRWHWAAFDEDGNERIHRDEWEDRLGDWFDSADRDDDDRLTEQELQERVFAWWDQDGDGHVERGEFDPTLIRAFGADERLVDLRTWDRDVDLRVDPDEFAEGWRQMGLHDRWDRDRDGELTDDELKDGWFETWDLDGSGAIERREWAWSAPPGA